MEKSFLRVIPLYDFAGRKALKPSAEANAGLWFNKFVKWRAVLPNPWDVELELDSEVVKAVLEPFGEQRQGLYRLLTEYVRRLRRMAEAMGGVYKEVRNTTAFVTGLGLPHPGGNSMLWHHTLGVPYLPGSSLKGLVRAWAEEQKGGQEDLVIEVFGDPPTEEEEGHGRAGGVCFMDMVPLEPVELKLEIITPHYRWDGPGKAPGDWLEPTPIYYLVVAPHNRFQVCLLPKNPAFRELAEIALNWTLEALEKEGAGAKSFALGFGRFSLAREGLRPRLRLARGDELEGRLLPHTTKKGLALVELYIGGPEGMVINTPELPDGLGPGDTIRVKVEMVPVSASERVAVRYITEE